MKQSIVYVVSDSLPPSSVHIHYDGHTGGIVLEATVHDYGAKPYSFEFQLTEEQEEIVQHAQGRLTDRDVYNKVFEEAFDAARGPNMKGEYLAGGATAVRVIQGIRDELFKRRNRF